MFWNAGTAEKAKEQAEDKLQHKMFWNYKLEEVVVGQQMINFNIRCFEISARERRGWKENDKLQHKMFWNPTESEYYYSAPR